MKIFGSFASVLLIASTVATPALARSRYLQCVPFARQTSGIEIYGNAKTWWTQAAGRYERGQTPKIGAVMAMPGIRSMPLGHVATVSKIVSDREILITHANWSRRGGIERNVRAIDVSTAGDWSRVRVWFAGNGDLGTTTYPVSGFIYPSQTDGVEKSPNVQMASANMSFVAKAKRAPLMLSEEVINIARSEPETVSFD